MPSAAFRRAPVLFWPIPRPSSSSTPMFPQDTPLPRRVRADVVEEIFATGRPSVSNVFVGAFIGRLVVSIDVPVIIDGRVRYDLALTLPIDELNALLRGQKIPETWFAGVVDSRRHPGRAVAAPGAFRRETGGGLVAARDQDEGRGTGRDANSRRRRGCFDLEPFRPVSLGCSNRHTEGCADGAVVPPLAGPAVGRPDGGCDRCRARLSARVLDRAAACPAAAARAGACFGRELFPRCRPVSVRSISSMNTCGRRRIPSAISGRISRC